MSGYECVSGYVSICVYFFVIGLFVICKGGATFVRQFFLIVVPHPSLCCIILVFFILMENKLN